MQLFFLLFVYSQKIQDKNEIICPKQDAVSGGKPSHLEQPCALFGIAGHRNLNRVQSQASKGALFIKEGEKVES